MYLWNFKSVNLTLTLIVSVTAYGAGNNLLDEYVRLGLENNLAWKQKRVNYGVPESKIRRNMTELMHMEMQERLNLEIISAWNELVAVHKAIDAASAQLRPAR